MKYGLILITLFLVGCTNKNNDKQTGWSDLSNIKEQPVNHDIPQIEEDILNK